MSAIAMNHDVESLRIGDRERERAAQRLQQAVAQGYLTLTEYETASAPSSPPRPTANCGVHCPTYLSCGSDCRRPNDARLGAVPRGSASPCTWPPTR